MKASRAIKMSEVLNRSVADFTISYEMVRGIKLKHFPGSLLSFSYEKTKDINKVYCDIFSEFRKGKRNEFLEPDNWIPTSGKADMWIVSDRNKEFHYASIHTGRKCYLMHGNKLVAVASITRVSGELKKALK